MRKTLLILIVISASLVFILRLYYLQVYATEPYSIYEDNAIKYTHGQLHTGPDSLLCCF